MSASVHLDGKSRRAAGLHHTRRVGTVRSPGCLWDHGRHGKVVARRSACNGCWRHQCIRLHGAPMWGQGRTSSDLGQVYTVESGYVRTAGSPFHNLGSLRDAGPLSSVPIPHRRLKRTSLGRAGITVALSSAPEGDCWLGGISRHLHADFPLQIGRQWS